MRLSEHPPKTSDFGTELRPRRADLPEYEFDGEAVVFDRRTQGLHWLNETALSVLRKCDGRSTIPELAEELAREYRVSDETAVDHVEQLVVLFAHANLLAEEGMHAGGP